MASSVWFIISICLIALCALQGAALFFKKDFVKKNGLNFAHQSLQKFTKQVTASLDAIPDPVWIKDQKQVYIYCNAPFEALIGLPKNQLLGFTDEDIQTRQHAHPIIDITSKISPGYNEEWVTLADGTMDFFQIGIAPSFDNKAKLVSTLGYAKRLTEYKERESQLKDSEIRINEALKLTKVGIWEWDVTNDIWFATPSYFIMLGYSPVEGAASRKQELEKVHPDDRAAVLATIQNILTNKSPSNYYKYQARIRHKNGEYRWIGVRCIVTEFDSKGNPSRMLGVRIDIDEIRKANDQVEWLAHHDSLTKLPNRESLNQAFHQLIKTNTKLALLFIDLDHFKKINDTLGHVIGDQLLQNVADRMRHLVKDIRHIARQGGDEFMILLPAENMSNIESKTIEIKNALSERYYIDQHQFFITPSIGVSFYPENSENFETLYKQADTAMYHAKNAGRNRYAFFNQEMQAASTRSLMLSNALHDALLQNEFSLHFQPQISLSTTEVIGAEALIRWHSKSLGHVSPGEFIPLAEESGQILSIGEWVLRETVRQIRTWLNNDIKPVRIAVNLSYAQFQTNDLPILIADILKEFNVSSEYLELELTERTAAIDPEHTVATLESLQQIGTHTSMDDFGTGYSSLSYLQRFPIYKLKIDQSFVRNMANNYNDRIIVGTIILLAQQLGMRTIAEGVETEEQLDLLKTIGCDDAQGYYISRPIPAERFELEFLTKH